MNALDKNTLSKIKNILFQYLDPERDKVFIYGSRATGGARKFSDVDIGVKRQRAKIVPADTISDLKEAFEESDIPYTVDVVDFSGVSDRFKSVALGKIIPLN